jgi:deoxyribonuclease-4
VCHVFETVIILLFGNKEGKMPALGCHLSTTGGFYAMGKTALAIGADTFQFFTRNPRGGKAKQIDAEDVGRLLRLMKENGFSQVIAHAPYTLNPCGSDPRVLQFAEMTMKDDLLRMEHLPHQYYNFHPGSHVGQGTEEGIRKISELLNRLLTKEQTTTVLLETMAGKGSEVGGTFGEIRQIIDRVQLKDKIGVCLDTCHVFDAGYDIVSHPEEVLADFDREIGLENLKAVHLNDSKNCLGSHRDRHECIGKGMIGLPALKRIFRHPALQGLPFCLETPNDLDGYREEIRLLRLPE